MPGDVKVNSDIQIIEVRSYGNVTEEDLRWQLSETQRLSDESGIRRVLIDATEEERLPSTMEFFEFMSTLPSRTPHPA